MPVKNEADYLESCLLSILDQKEENWELIAIDDHSDDASLSILESYVAKDQRIKVFKNDGEGIIDALSCAIQKTKGEFITRMDADDLMHSNKLKLLKEALGREHNRMVSVCQVEYFSNEALGSGYKKYEGWINDLLDNNLLFTELYKECVIPSCAWMVRKSDILKFKMLEGLEIPEDYDLCFRFYQYDFTIVPIKKKLHLWRDHQQRTSRTNPLYNIRKFDVFKLRHFVQNELTKSDQLVIWGAGDKGKRMIQELLQKNIDVRWITTNERKIDQQIYGVLLEPPETLSALNQVKIIVALSNPTDQKNVELFLNNLSLTLGVDYFFFF